MGNMSTVIKVGMNTSEVASSVADVNRRLKILDSEFAKTAEEAKLLGNETEILAKKQKMLTEKIVLQSEKVQRLKTDMDSAKGSKGEDAKETQNLTMKYNSAEKALLKMQNELKDANTKIKTQSSLLGNLSIKMSELATKTKALGQGMKSFGTSMSIAISAPLALIGKTTADFAMEAVESENLFEISMGDMAKCTRKWSEELRNQFGLNAYDVRKNVATFNTMFDSMNIGTEKAFDMSKGLTQLSYDMASFYNLKSEEAFQKLQAGITGEIEPLKRLGIVINDATVKTYAYKNHIAKTGEALTEQQKILARYQLIMEQTSKAQGDLGRTLDSPMNQLRIFKEQLKEVGIQIGNAVIPIVTRLIAAIRPFVTWLSNISDETRSVIVGFGLFLTVVFPIISIVGRLIGVINSVSQALKFLSEMQIISKISTISDTVAKGANIVATYAQAAATSIAAVAQIALNVAMAAAPYVLVAAGIAAIIAGIVLLVKNFDKVKEFAKKLGQEVANFVGVIIDAISRPFVAVYNFIKMVVDTVANFFKTLKGLFPYLIDGFKTGLNMSLGIPSYAIKTDGSHRSGLERVPYDGYIAELHQGEEVLRADDPRNQNNSFTTNNRGGNIYNITIDAKNVRDFNNVIEIVNGLKQVNRQGVTRHA